MDNFDLKQFLVENKITPNSRLGENINEVITKPSNTGYWLWKPNAKALGNIFYEEDGEYFYDDAKLIELIKSMNYKDAEEIAKEITTISSPEDDLEMFQNIYNKPDLKIEDITLDMMKKSIKDEF
jgi:hypothetical protein